MVVSGLVLLALALPARAEQAAPVDCRTGRGAYAEALCLYQSGSLDEAAEIFQQIIHDDAREPATIRAHYFLARIRMREERWEDASRILIGIFSRSRQFYLAWNCDFLLGQCRRALGKDS